MSPTPLAEKLAREIRRHGPMTFRTFMERALYEPGLGYYEREHTAWEEAADFVTAPQVNEAFGIAVAGLAIDCDGALGRPAVSDDGAAHSRVHDAVTSECE